MKLSEHFDLAEFTQSQTAERLGLDNTPPSDILPKLNTLAVGMERVRALLGKPITVTSGYRSIAVNLAVGSKSTSQHIRGEACDFICPAFGSPAAIMRAIVGAKELGYDQLILEFPNSSNGGWVHISFTEQPRNVALVVDKAGTRAFA